MSEDNDQGLLYVASDQKTGKRNDIEKIWLTNVIFQLDYEKVL